MNKFLFLLTFLFVGCTLFGTYNELEIKYQSNGLPLTELDAIRTNYYGMGLIKTTRTTDGGVFSDAQTLLDIYNNSELSLAEPIKDAWWVLLFNEDFYCEVNGGSEHVRCDMPGFNQGDDLGKCVYIAENEQLPNISYCGNGAVHGLDYNPHKTYFVYKTDGVYTFVEIHVLDSNGLDCITKVYCTFDNNPVSNYYVLVEDLAGTNLDFNDLVILGGINKKPRIIYRAAALPMKIIYQGNVIYECPVNDFGEKDIELNLNNMNTPNDWKNIIFEVNGIEIPVLLKSLKDTPCVIGTKITYNFHKDENTMKVIEFLSIPFYE